MPVHFSRLAVRILVRQHAWLHPRQASAIPTALCDSSRRSSRTIPALHPLPARGLCRTDLPQCRRPVAQGQHSRHRCYCQRPDGPRSLQSLAEERRRQSEGEPSDELPPYHRRRQSGVQPDDEVPTERRRTAAQRSWVPRAAQPHRAQMPGAVETDGDESGYPVQPRRRNTQRSWRPASAQPYRRRVPEPTAADGDEETEQPDSQTSRRAKEIALQKAKASAGGMLLRRPHSEAELRAKLTDRGHPEDAIDAAIARLQELGQQSDSEYAAVLARSKWRQSRWAPSRIRMELSRKGLAAADVDTALRDLFGERMTLELEFADDAEDRRPAGPDAQFAAEPHLLDATRKQLELSRALPTDTRRRRLISWLQRRGHSWDNISKLLQQTELARQ